MTELPEILSTQRFKEVSITNNFQSVSPAAAFGIDWSSTSELTLGVFGGIAPDGTEKTDTTLTLTGSQTNYVEMTTAGVVSSNTSAYTAGRVKLFRITTNADGITSYIDDRSFAPGGLSVSGPTSSTDNAIARFDGTTGKLIQNSVVTIGDTGAMAGVTSLTIAQGTIADPANAFTVTSTWNDAADTFVGADMNITDTASAAGSILQRWRVAGNAMATLFKSGALLLAGILTLPVGAVGAPALTLGDATTGIYRPAADALAIANSGVLSLYVDASGRISIGSTPAASMLTINGPNNLATDSRIMRINSTFTSNVTATQYALEISPTFTPSGASLTSIRNIYQEPILSSSSLNVTNFFGNHISLRTLVSYTGVITNARAFIGGAPQIAGTEAWTNYTHFHGEAVANGNGKTSGTFTNIGLDVAAFTAAAGSGGTIVNIGARITMATASNAGNTHYGLRITGTGGASSTNWALYSDSVNNWHTAAVNVLIGHTATLTIGQSNRVQIAGNASTVGGLSLSRFSADALGTKIEFSKSRSGTVGTNTIAQNNDVLGEINAYGADGTNYDLAAQTLYEVNGTPGAGTDMPGRIRDLCSPDGSATPLEVLRRSSVASAVNYISIINAATGAGGSINAAGSDTDINLPLVPKGTGKVQFGTHSAIAAETITGYITIKDSGGTDRKIAVVS